MSASQMENRLGLKVRRWLGLRAALLLIAVHLVFGPPAVRAWLIGEITVLGGVVSHALESWKLHSLKARISSGRSALEQINRERDALQAKVRELDETRDRLAAQLSQARSSTQDLVVALAHSTDHGSVDLGDRRYREYDVRARTDDWLLRTSDLERLLEESAAARAQLLSGIADLDRRISDRRRGLETQERAFEIELTRSAGSHHRDNLIRHLSLETDGLPY